MPFGLTFNFPDVSPLQFWLTLGLGILVIILLSFYLGLFVWYFGKPMRKYLIAKFNFGQGIIQEYTHENVQLKLAKFKDGEFTDLERSGQIERHEIRRSLSHYMIAFISVLLLSVIISVFLGLILAIVIFVVLAIITIIILKRPVYKTIIKSIKPIVAQSITSINGVATLMLWNVNPPLPERYLEALDILIKTGYTNTESIKQDTESKLIKFSDSIDGDKAMSYEEFLLLHEKVKSRNEIIVTPDDILGFSKKYMDEHAKKSVIEKEVTVQQKRATDNKYKTYAFMIILAMIIGGFIMIAYKIHTGNVK